MPYPARVKALAYLDDPFCWQSYSGMAPSVKRLMDVRRLAALQAAQRFIDVMDRISFRVHRRPEVPMPPMKIAMMLHFATVVGPYSTPEQRNCPAYVGFVRELLADGMIKRPSVEERAQYLGFAYEATEKGAVYVAALTALRLPVQAKPQWVMP